MRRRRFLAATALLGTPAFAGCLGSNQANPSTPTAVESVESWSFELGGGDQEERYDEPPTVLCFPDSDRVHVSGWLQAGDNCDTVAPERIARNGGEFTFVVAGHEGGECGDVLEVASYTADFTFADGLPDRVVAVEDPPENLGDRVRTEKTCP